MNNTLKKIYPIVVLIIFISLIFYYYNKNQTDFYFVKNINLILLLKIIFLSFLYLITEGFILKNIINFLGKKISLLESFLVMNFTYFCNTFIQFTGLGFRVYYVKKTKGIEIKKFIRFSLDTIACEIFIFTSFGLVSLIFIDITSSEINLSKFLYLIFIIFFSCTLIYLTLLSKIVFLIKKIFNKIGIIKLNNLFEIFLLESKTTKNLYLKQSKIFILQFLILFLIFFLILRSFELNNFFYLSLMTTSLVDFSFLLAFTPYSVGITEIVTFFGTRDTNFSLAEIIVLINLFRLCMLSIYFILGPIFFIIFLNREKKNGM